MRPYKIPHPDSEDDLQDNSESNVHEHRGRRDKCPACGVGLQTRATVCTGSWLPSWVPFGCKRTALHLHQKCWVCNAEWMCAPLQDFV